MKVLNLTNNETSDIKFEVSHFPDGQQDINLSYRPVMAENSSITENVTVKSRFNSFKDLELIVAATRALRRLGVDEIHLFIPYLLGSRSDRQFKEGGTSYLVDVIAPIINLQGYETVTVYDAHSDVSSACINHLKIIGNQSLVDFALKEIGRPLDQVLLVSPDAGAVKKAWKIADHIGYKGNVIICSKFRNLEGAISRVEVPFNSSEAGKDFIIIDDICDGGATFINIVKAIMAKMETAGVMPGSIHLIITHGIFSRGVEPLIESGIDTIYCTNSVSDIEHPLLKQLNIF